MKWKLIAILTLIFILLVPTSYGEDAQTFVVVGGMDQTIVEWVGMEQIFFIGNVSLETFDVPPSLDSPTGAFIGDIPIELCEDLGSIGATFASLWIYVFMCLFLLAMFIINSLFIGLEILNVIIFLALAFCGVSLFGCHILIGSLFTGIGLIGFIYRFTVIMFL